MAIEPVLKKHVKLRQRLQKYGQLKEELSTALDKQDLTEAELDAMKFNIESHFAQEDDTSPKYMFGICTPKWCRSRFAARAHQ